MNRWENALRSTVKLRVDPGWKLRGEAGGFANCRTLTSVFAAANRFNRSTRAQLMLFPGHGDSSLQVVEPLLSYSHPRHTKALSTIPCCRLQGGQTQRRYTESSFVLHRLGCVFLWGNLPTNRQTWSIVRTESKESLKGMLFMNFAGFLRDPFFASHTPAAQTLGGMDSPAAHLNRPTLISDSPL